MPQSSEVMNAINDVFKGRVKFFMQKGAVAILTEAIATAGHATRAIYAKKVLDGTASVEEFAIGVAGNSTIAAAMDGGAGDSAVTDNDLEFAVNSLLNPFAGFETGT